MAKSPKTAPKTIQMLQVIGPAKGRWRIGRHFSPVATALAVGDLTETEIERLMADPELTVVATEAVAEADDAQAVADAAAIQAAADQAALDNIAADMAAAKAAEEAAANP